MPMDIPKTNTKLQNQTPKKFQILNFKTRALLDWGAALVLIEAGPRQDTGGTLLSQRDHCHL